MKWVKGEGTVTLEGFVDRQCEIHREIVALEADGMSSDDFKLAFRHHPAGVALITADDGVRLAALTATSVFSVSAEPPLLVFSISDFSSSSSTIKAADTVVIHLLSADQLDLAKLGATSGVDRFADTGCWNRLPTGEPYFLAARTWIRGRIVGRMRAGTSTVVAVHALEAQLPREDAAPLVYHNRNWHRITEQSRIGA